MIKILKKIRQSFIFQGKTGMYVTYALGEVVLVVVGILIALQISIWSELKKAKETEKVFLKEIVSDLNYNEEDAVIGLKQGYRISRDSILKVFDYLINRLETKEPYQDKLALHFYEIHQLPSISIKSSGFESLKSSGMDIILDDSLRSLIGEYNTATITSTKDIYTELRDDFYNYMLKFPRTLFITKQNDEGLWTQVPINYDFLLENNEYIESLKMFSGIYYINLISTKDYLNETKALKSKIEKYLNENDSD